MDGTEEGGHCDNLTAVMESMGIYDTDLRARTQDNARANASAVNETQRLLKILLATLNKAVHQGSLPAQSNHGEPSGPAALETEPESRHQNELTLHTNYTEVRPFTSSVVVGSILGLDHCYLPVWNFCCPLLLHEMMGQMQKPN